MSDENDFAQLQALGAHQRKQTPETIAVKSPHILSMFHVSEDENICLSAEASPDTNAMTIDNGDFELTLSFDEIEAWIGCLTRGRDLLLYHRKGGVR